jgi:hypothetical protein
VLTGPDSDRRNAVGQVSICRLAGWLRLAVQHLVRPDWTTGVARLQTAPMSTSNGEEMIEPEVGAADQDFTELRRRRAELLESINALEQALAAPVPGGQIKWVQGVSDALLELSGDFHDHVELTEGPAGLYARVNRSSPRLSHQVERLIQDHHTLTELISELLTVVGKAAGTFARGDSMVVALDEVRDRGTTLIAALVRHRQRGSDLMYEGYSVDIGGQD